MSLTNIALIKTSWLLHNQKHIHTLWA